MKMLFKHSVMVMVRTGIKNNMRKGKIFFSFLSGVSKRKIVVTAITKGISKAIQNKSHFSEKSTEEKAWMSSKTKRSDDTKKTNPSTSEVRLHRTVKRVTSFGCVSGVLEGKELKSFCIRARGIKFKIGKHSNIKKNLSLVAEYPFSEKDFFT